MPYPKTQAFRPVSRAVQQALGGGLPSGAFNFGLYFMKWFFVADGLPPQGAPDPKKPWACCLSDETRLKQEGQFFEPNIFLDNLEVSLALFNGGRHYNREILKKDHKGKFTTVIGPMPVPASWDRQQLAALLTQKHQALEAAAQSFTRLGYEYLKMEFLLTSSLVLGLGLEHPSEKGFRFDWTMGLPVIPASGIKGVARLAWLVQELNRQPDEDAAQEFAQQVLEKNTLPDSFRRLFGAGGEKDALRGGVVFLDAYPATLPRLKAEIMNCHYPDYLNQARRGPTEDQRPNPQKYWAVDPLGPDGTPLAFVFRLLLGPAIAGNDSMKEDFLQAFTAALTAHGLGAKTAVGHGRFHKKEEPAPPATGQQLIENGSHIREETWEVARLSWNPATATLTAATKKGKAFLRDKKKVQELLPGDFYEKVVEKRQPQDAQVVVKDFRILKVKPL